MRGFSGVAGVSGFCSALAEVRDHVRTRRTSGAAVPLAEQGRGYVERLAELDTLLAA